MVGNRPRWWLQRPPSHADQRKGHHSAAVHGHGGRHRRRTARPHPCRSDGLTGGHSPAGPGAASGRRKQVAGRPVRVDRRLVRACRPSPHQRCRRRGRPTVVPTVWPVRPCRRYGSSGSSQRVRPPSARPHLGDLLGEGAKVGDLKAFATARAVARRTACSSAAPRAESQTRTVTAGAIRRPTCWATAAGRSGSGSTWGT